MHLRHPRGRLFLYTAEPGRKRVRARVNPVYSGTWSEEGLVSFVKFRSESSENT